MLAFGILGYLMKKLSLEAAPMVLAFVLGPMMETALRQSLIKSDGSFYDILYTTYFASFPYSCGTSAFDSSASETSERNDPAPVIGGDDEI